MTNPAGTWDWADDGPRWDFAFKLPDAATLLKQVLKFAGLEDRSALCLPLPGETACACSSGEGHTYKVTHGDPLVIEGWIAFPTAIADGTATGTVFLEATPEAGLRSRVVANLAVERGGIQNWIHFRLPFGEELEIEKAYGVRATLVATDALTGEKRLFGTTRAASLRHHKSEAGIILELEDWG